MKQRAQELHLEDMPRAISENAYSLGGELTEPLPGGERRRRDRTRLSRFSSWSWKWLPVLRSERRRARTRRPGGRNGSTTEDEAEAQDRLRRPQASVPP